MVGTKGFGTSQLPVPKGTSLPVAGARASAQIDRCAPPRRTAKRDKILREALRSAQSL